MKIERECFTAEAFTKEQIASLLRNADVVGLLARVDGEIAGFIIGAIEYQIRARVGHILTIDVVVKHRRKGVGAKVLQAIENAFVERGAKISYLEVRVDNMAARRLYQKQGYEEIEPLNHYYSKGVHGLRLRKQLRPTLR